MKNFLIDLKRTLYSGIDETTGLSLFRIILVLAVLLLIGITIADFCDTARSFAHYEALCTFVFGVFTGCIGNKAVDKMKDNSNE